MNPPFALFSRSSVSATYDSDPSPTQLVEDLQMRLSISSLYAARVTARQSSGACRLCRTAGHKCSPLCPWLHHLRGVIKIEYTNDPNASAMLRPMLFDALVLDLYQRPVNRCLEAIELLLLAAQLDPVNTWERHIRIDCQPQNYYPPLIQSTEMPRLRLVMYSGEAVVKWLKWMQQPKVRSLKYRLTRKWLLKEHRSTQRYSEPPLQRIPLLIRLVGLGHHTRSNPLSATATAQICMLASRRESKKARFQLIEIHCYESYSERGCRTAKSRFYQDTDMYSCGFTQAQLLHLHDAGVRIQFSEQDDYSSTVFTRRFFVRGDVINPVEVFKTQGFTSYISHVWWQVVRGVKEIHLDDCEGNRRQIAVALLDPRSPTSVEHVYLSDSITNHALADMLWKLRWAYLFQQVGRRQLTASRYQRTTRSHLRSLSLKLDSSIQEDKSLFFELLRIVGSHLETLSIDYVKPRHRMHPRLIQLDGEDLVLLFSVCPKLQCLSLRNVPFASFDLIIDAYNTGLCPSLKSFIHSGHVDDLATVASLFEACNDPHQQVHRTLRDVEFTHLGRHGEQALHRIFDAIRHNRTLRHIALDLVKDLYTTEQRDELLNISRTPVLVHSDRLPLAHKLAFLSAVRSRLDQDACRQVLEFTGEKELRRVVWDAVQLVQSLPHHRGWSAQSNGAAHRTRSGE